MDILLGRESLRVTSTAVELVVDNYQTAETFVRLYARNFARWALEFDRPHTLIHYGNSKPIKIPVCLALEEPMLESVMLPGIQVATIRLSLPLVRELNHFLEHPEEKWSLIKLSPNLQIQTQIAMSESSRSLVVGASVEQAINRQRQQYWHLPDLEEMNRTIRQELEPNNPRSVVTFSWLGYSPVTGTDWRRFTGEYRIIQDDQGTLFQVCKNIAVDRVSAPVNR